jgi:serine/threonine protein kinase
VATPGKAKTAGTAPQGRELSAGELLDGKYRIEQQLGRGGMGAVYQATHLGTRRTVAVKVIRPRFANDEEFVARFRREAEAAGRLRHPNVVDVTDFGFAQAPGGRVAYLVMEYLDGCTLAEVLAEERRLPRDFVVDILAQVCSAVDEAHRIGIIHRDLKPDNIWLEPNRRGGYTIKVLDFGLVKMEPLAGAGLGAVPDRAADQSPSLVTESPTLARPSAEAEAPSPLRERTASTPVPLPDDEQRGELTRAGSLLGTPLYMSPEQCRGETLDAGSDIYSLGVVAYRMLTGETPFAGTSEELVRLHTTTVPRPIRERARIPRRMARVVMSALAKDRSARPQTADGFAAALRAGAEGSGALLRQAIALYGERFPTFFRISLLGYAPLIAVVACLYLVDGDPPLVRLSSSVAATAGPALLLAMVVTSFTAYAVVTALIVPIVIEAMVAPLRPPLVRTAIASLGRRFRVFSLATVAVMAMVAGGAVLVALPGVLALLSHALYAPVAVIEGGTVRTILQRARALSRRSWTTVLVITVLQFALPILVWAASVHMSMTLRWDEHFRPKEYGYSLSTSGTAVLYQLLNVFVTPLTSIMTALLYLKTRHAGGESLLGTLRGLDALEMPQSRWQARLRHRSSSKGDVGTRPRSV